MYQTYYRLQADPFRSSPDPAFCYRHPSFSKSSCYTKYALAAGEGCVVVTGKPGIGKTTLMNDLLVDAHATDYFVVTLVPTKLGTGDLLNAIAQQFGLNSQNRDKATTIKRLKDAFILGHQTGQTPLLIIDEAQNLGLSALKELRLLTNLQMGVRPLLQVFLLGQEELRQRLLDPHLAQLHQRVTAATQLQPLTEEQTHAYILHRLRVVGWRNFPRINSSVLPIVHGICRGIPKRINEFCSHLLLHGAAEEKAELTAQDADIVAHGLKYEGLPKRTPTTTPSSGLGRAGKAEIDRELLVAKQSAPKAAVPPLVISMAPEPLFPWKTKIPDTIVSAKRNELTDANNGTLHEDSPQPINTTNALSKRRARWAAGIAVSLALPTATVLVTGWQVDLNPWRAQQAIQPTEKLGFLREQAPVTPAPDGIAEKNQAASDFSHGALVTTSYSAHMLSDRRGITGEAKVPRISPTVSATTPPVPPVPLGALITKRSADFASFLPYYHLQASTGSDLPTVPEEATVAHNTATGRRSTESIMDREPSSGPVAARNEDSLAQRARRQPVQRAEAVAQYQPKPGVQQELEERDTLIRELRQRVQRLEEKIEPEADRDRPPTSEAEVPPPSEETGPSKSEEDKPGKSAAPGQFEVDEEAAERALERTLIQEGALLFPFGQGEITPSFTYTREELERQLFATSGVVIGTRDVRRNEFTGGLALRIGLPFDSQLELGLPYRFVDQSSVDQFLRSQSEQDRSGSGLGDLSIGLAKTFLREGYWWPDVIGRVTWDSDTGDEVDNGVSLGGGFHEVAGSLVLLKRQDPLAFTGSVLYQAAFEKDSVSPGNEVSFSIGAALAASPDTSLRFSISQRFSEELEINDQVIEGSDQAVGLLTIGASSIITRGLFLNLSSGIGLSDDAPEYSVTLSLGKRFTVPTRF